MGEGNARSDDGLVAYFDVKNESIMEFRGKFCATWANLIRWLSK